MEKHEESSHESCRCGHKQEILIEQQLSHSILNTLLPSSNMDNYPGTKMGEQRSLLVAEKENTPMHINRSELCSQADINVQSIHGTTSCFTKSSGQRFIKRRLLPEISSVSLSLASQFEAVADSGS